MFGPLDGLICCLLFMQLCFESELLRFGLVFGLMTIMIIIAIIMDNTCDHIDVNSLIG